MPCSFTSSRRPLRRLLALLMLALSPAAWAQGLAPTWDWARAGTGNNTASTSDLAVDAAGNSYVVGNFHGGMTLGSTVLSSTGPYDPDGFLAKYTPSGTLAWVRHLGTSGSYESANGVAVDAAGNVYVSGRFAGPLTLGSITLNTSSGDAYLIKFDPQGSVQWAQQSSSLGMGSSAEGSDVALDAAGNVYLAGYCSWGGTRFGSLPLAPGPGDAYTHFLVKYNAAGTEQWARAAGSTLGNTVQPAFLLPGPGGEVYLTCAVERTAGFGASSFPSRGSRDAYLARYDELGNLQWVQQLGGPGSESVGRGVVDATGSVYLPLTYTAQARVGTQVLPNAGLTDQALLKLDAQGGTQWVHTVGGPDSDYAQCAALDPFGNVYLLGWFFGTTSSGGQSYTSNGHFDALLLSLTPQGLPRWGVSAGGLNPDSFDGIGFDATGRGRVCGRFSESLTLGSTGLTAPRNTGNWYVAAFTDQQPTVATISTLAPASGAPGQVVTLSGTGFVGVTDVQFNGTSAAFFTVESASRLRATVPVGATTGPVSVRTRAGSGGSATSFQLTPLAARPALAAPPLALYPNPAHHLVQLPALPAGTAVQLVDALGRVARTTAVAAGGISVSGLPAGLYQLRARDAQGRPRAGRVLVQ